MSYHSTVHGDLTPRSLHLQAFKRVILPHHTLLLCYRCYYTIMLRHGESSRQLSVL